VILLLFPIVMCVQLVAYALLMRFRWGSDELAGTSGVLRCKVHKV